MLAPNGGAMRADWEADAGNAGLASLGARPMVKGPKKNNFVGRFYPNERKTHHQAEDVVAALAGGGKGQTAGVRQAQALKLVKNVRISPAADVTRSEGD